jgi:hypothetical protein
MSSSHAMLQERSTFPTTSDAMTNVYAPQFPSPALLRVKHSQQAQGTPFHNASFILAIAWAPPP